MTKPTETVAPLDDPAYQPANPPVDGAPPDVVRKWGAPSQLRWFRRFHDDLKPQTWDFWAEFHCESEHHRGQCCESCIQDGEVFEDVCCCRAMTHSPAAGATS